MTLIPFFTAVRVFRFFPEATAAVTELGLTGFGVRLSLFDRGTDDVPLGVDSLLWALTVAEGVSAPVFDDLGSFVFLEVGVLLKYAKIFACFGVAISLLLPAYRLMIETIQFRRCTLVVQNQTSPACKNKIVTAFRHFLHKY